MKKSYFILAICISVFSKNIGQNLYFPPTIGDDWESISTADLNWCDDQLDDLTTFLEEKDTKAFMILKDGRIAVEWYYGTFTQDSLWYWASAGKGLTATLVGIAQEEGLLSIDDPTQNYLGTAWTNTSPEQEAQISIRHQLTMTSGLNDLIFSCTAPGCLNYLAPVDTRWAYHNGPYTLLGNVIEAASGVSLNAYFTSKIGTIIGAQGAYVSLDFNKIFFSTARSMARFGLLIQANGKWGDVSVLGDMDYLNAMTSPSQQLNPAYGYLWWLNGQENFRLPGSQMVFNGSLINTAPSDLFAALGKNDQKIYIVPSEGLVVIRMGEAANESLALSSFDNELWGKIMDLSCSTATDEASDHAHEPIIVPNPVKNQLSLDFDGQIEQCSIYNSNGTMLGQFHHTTADLSHLASGVYYLKIKTKAQALFFRKFVKQ